MDYFVDLLKKIWHLLVYIISIISGLMGILCFFGIDYSKMKPTILLIINRLRKNVCKTRACITYNYRKCITFLFNQYLNVSKLINKIKKYFMKSIFSTSVCCLLLCIMFFYKPFEYLNKAWFPVIVVDNDEFNQIFYTQSMCYFYKSLEFDMDAEDKETRIKYIQKIYKDIADCNTLNDEIRFRSMEVYNAIDNVLTILNSENLSSYEVKELKE